ncbi:MAG TPA: hypothetical protein PKC65_02435 [Pyrinomonadaceae bacterium]|nr:hypothetical protein [Pyrinomonadaceae bacterium]
MRRLAAILLLTLLGTACEPALSSFDKDVGSLIDKSCNFDTPCQITIGDATSFDWDEMYIFRPGILNGEAKAILPAVDGFQGEFNRKIAFLKNGRLVRIDEAASIIEGEHTPPGMLFFDIEESGNPDCIRYSRDAMFNVTKDKWIRGNVYRLACANCKSSAVYAEFGAGSR